MPPPNSSIFRDNILFSRRDRVRYSFAPAISCAVFTAIFFVIFIRCSVGKPICFGDCNDYIVAMGVPFSARANIIQANLRPWFVPAFFSLFGKYSSKAAQEIVITQTIIFFLSWVTLSFVVAFVRIRHRLVSPIAYCFLLSLAMLQGFYHFNQFLLTDSLGLSSIVFLLALVLANTAPRDDESVPSSFWIELAFYFLVLISAVVASTTRDANVMLAICLVGYLVCAAWRRTQTRWIGVALAIASLYAVHLNLPFQVYRHRINAENIFVGYVLPDQTAREFFVKNGMPPAIAEKGKSFRLQHFGNVDIDAIYKGRNAIDPLLSKTGFLVSFDPYYLKFAWHHPLSLARITLENWRLIFLQDFTAAELGISNGKEIRPLFVSGDFGAYLCVFSIGIYIVFLIFASKLPLFPIIVSLSGAGNAILAFNGDLWATGEMERHAFIGSIFFRLGAVMAAICLANFVLTKRKSAGDEITPPAAPFKRARAAGQPSPDRTAE